MRDAGWSPTGAQIATASEDGTLRLWSAETGAQEGVLEGHTGAVFGLAWAPGGRMMASTGDDRTVRTWNVRNLKPAQSQDDPDADTPGRVVWSPSGAYFLTAHPGGILRAWSP